MEVSQYLLTFLLDMLYLLYLLESIWMNVVVSKLGTTLDGLGFFVGVKCLATLLSKLNS